VEALLANGVPLAHQQQDIHMVSSQLEPYPGLQAPSAAA